MDRHGFLGWTDSCFGQKRRLQGLQCQVQKAWQMADETARVNTEVLKRGTFGSSPLMLYKSQWIFFHKSKQHQQWWKAEHDLLPSTNRRVFYIISIITVVAKQKVFMETQVVFSLFLKCTSGLRSSSIFD